MKKNEGTQQLTDGDSVPSQSTSLHPSGAVTQGVFHEKRQEDRRLGDRRGGLLKQEVLKQPLVVDERKKLVRIGDREIRLTPKEFKLFSLLTSEPGRIFSSAEIIECAWMSEGRAAVEDVQQYVYMLRQKLESDPKNPQLIVTAHGFGYGLELPAPE
jgi:DNA-binding response OmpR family regulator